MGLKLSSFVKPALAAAAGYMTGGASGAVTGAVGVGQDMLSSAETLAQQKKLADYNFAQNLSMWNLNNAYNDPSAQMARLEKAGLNKNLVYGGGNVTGNTSGSTPTYDAGNYQPVDKSIQRQQLTLALKEHQQRITNQAIENELARERIGLAQRDADRQDRLADAQIQAYRENYGLSIERNDLTRENNRLLSQDRDERIAHMKWKTAHDDWRKRINLLENNKMWKWMNQAEREKYKREIGLGREPQLRDYY